MSRTGQIQSVSSPFLKHQHTVEVGEKLHRAAESETSADVERSGSVINSES